jgi:tetratricopeptide (TPR) repeat protein
LPVLAVPPTLQASLLARLDRLDGTRTLVHTCAALGRAFSYEVLKAVTALSDQELEPLIVQLVESDLVHQRGSVPNASYSFKHALIQDAAYETMLKVQRARIHRRIVEVFEHDFPEFPVRNPDVMAHHCREAGLPEKAIDFSILAARMALARSAGVEAQAQVEQAITLLPAIAEETPRRRLEGRLQVALADAMMMTKGFASQEVMSALLRARELLDEDEQPMEALRALCGLFNFHLMRSESPLCLDLAVPLLNRYLDRPTENVARYLVGTAHLHIGNFRDSIGHLETALSLYDEDLCRSVAFVLGYHLRSFTLIWLGLDYLYVGSQERAAETISAAVDDARSRAHPFTLVSALLALARFRIHIHDLKGAIDATEEGLAIATEQRSPYHMSRANVLRAVNVVESGQVKEGIKLMERALIAHRKTGANFQSSYNLSRLAEAYARAGRFKRALQLADEAVADVRRSGEQWWEAEAERLRGEILLSAAPERTVEAERCFRTALACAKRQGARLWEFQATQSLARVCRAQGRNDEAHTLLAPLAGTFPEVFETSNLPRPN